MPLFLAAPPESPLIYTRTREKGTRFGLAPRRILFLPHPFLPDPPHPLFPLPKKVAKGKTMEYNKIGWGFDVTLV